MKFEERTRACDKEIEERMRVCFKKADRIVADNMFKTDEHIVSRLVDTALALYKEGYKGIKRSLIENIQALGTDDGYIAAGSPSFLGLFGRDSLITAWQLLDYDPFIARNTLIALAENQGTKTNNATGEQPGKILHEYYSSTVSDEWWNKYKASFKWLKRGIPVYFSIDSTPLFCIVAEEYLKKTGDQKFYDYIKPFLKKALDWINGYGFIKNHSFIRYEGKDEKTGLTNQGWKDSNNFWIPPPVAMVEIQGYAYAAGKIAEPRYKVKNNILDPWGGFAADFQDAFWMSDEQYYAFALDRYDEQITEITSNPGHLLFTEILSKAKEKQVVKKLFSDELWTPYGIRTHSKESDIFDPLSYHCGSVWPHDNWMIAQGLKKQGYKKEYQQVKDAMFSAYDELGYIPELYGVTVKDQLLKIPACYPQAWASGALLNFVLEDEK